MKRSAAALAALFLVASCSSESDAHKGAREDSNTEAGYYCTMTPAGNTPGYLDSDEYARCVRPRRPGSSESGRPSTRTTDVNKG